MLRLEDYPVERILSSPTLRCRQTVEPLARDRLLGIEPVAALGVDAGPVEVRSAFWDRRLQNAVLCTHGETISQLFMQLEMDGMEVLEPLHWPKGSTWLLWHTQRDMRARYLPPLALDPVETRRPSVPGPSQLGNARRHPSNQNRRQPADRARGEDMAIGPVQLIVLGFNHPDFHGEVIEELERLRESDTVRVIDALAVHKDAEGEIEVAHLSNLTLDEAVEFGSKVGALIGLGIEGEEGLEAGAALGAEAAADGVRVFSDEDAWDVLEDIPNDSAAALLLLEHHWAVPLRDAIARAGGFRLSDGFISPLDLVAIGLLSAEEAKELHAMERSAAATTP